MMTLLLVDFAAADVFSLQVNFAAAEDFCTTFACLFILSAFASLLVLLYAYFALS